MPAPDTHRGRRAAREAVRQKALLAIDDFCWSVPSALLLSDRLPGAVLDAIEAAGLTLARRTGSGA